MTARMLIGACICVAGLAELNLEAARAEVFSGSKVTQSDDQAGNWFAIMGHVGAPRTYELPTRAPSLVKFIALAGGLDPEHASGQIRVIRKGRVHHFYYQERSTETLMPGDLVIADGRIGQGRVFRGAASQESSTDRKWIGLIGLRDWPVVMYEVGERATVRAITQMLGQGDAAANAVEAILPTRTGQVSPDQLLPSGSVLIFDSATIDASRLPRELPVPERPTVRQPQMAAAAPQGPVANGDSAAGQPGSVGPSVPDGQPVPSYSGRTTIRGPGDAGVPRDDVARREDEEFARDVLSDPRAVSVDPVVTPRPGHARIQDQSDRTSANASAPSPNPSAGSAEGPTSRIRIQAPAASMAAEPADEAAASGSVPAQPKAIPSPVAEAPFVSEAVEPGRITSGGGDRPAIGGSDPRSNGSVLTQVPLVRTDSNTTDSDDDDSVADSPIVSSPSAGSQEAGSALRPRPDVSNGASDNAATNSDAGGDMTGGGQPLAIRVDRVRIEPNPTGPSLAMEAATSTATSPSTSSAFAEASGSGTTSGRAPFPTPVGFVPDSATTNDSVATTTATTAAIATTTSVAGATITRAAPRVRTWAEISLYFGGGLVALYGLAMVWMTMRQKPIERPAPVRTDQYWLDRIIENDLPVETEAVVLPSEEQLFGRPQSVAVSPRRIDAAQAPVRRPHFPLSAMTSENVESAPHSTTSQRGSAATATAVRTEPDPNPDRRTAGRDADFAPTTDDVVDDDVELSGTEATGTAPTESQSDPSGKSRPIFRLDRGHRMPGVRSAGLPTPRRQPVDPQSQATSVESSSASSDAQLTDNSAAPRAIRPVGQRTAADISIQPAAAVREGTDLLDRILATVGSANTLSGAGSSPSPRSEFAGSNSGDSDGSREKPSANGAEQGGRP